MTPDRSEAGGSPSVRLVADISDRLDYFIDECVFSGRYKSRDEVVGAAIRLLEEHELRLDAMRSKVIDG